MFDFRRFVSFSIPLINSIAFNETNFHSKIFSHFLKVEFPFAWFHLNNQKSRTKSTLALHKLLIIYSIIVYFK